MKTMLIKLATTLLLPVALLSMAGCKSAPVNPLATPQKHPALAGGYPVVQTTKEKALVSQLTPEQRGLDLRSKQGVTVNCKAAPSVTNYHQLKVGQKVKATLTDAVVVYPAKSGPPPAGTGLEIGGPVGDAGKVVLQTRDARGKITKVDPSYRLLTVQYANAAPRELKVPLSSSLENVRKGDEVVVRVTEPLVLQIQPR